MNTIPTTQATRRKPNHAVRDNDYVTIAQCAKIAAGIAQQIVAQAIDEHDRLKREARWHRRLLAWLRRPRPA